MVFGSPAFIFVFLPLFFASYYLVPHRARNGLIFVGSVLFYFVGATYVAFVLVLTVPLNHYCGHYVHRNLGTRRATAAVLVGILANLAPLLVYKYLAFFTQGLNDGLFLDKENRRVFRPTRNATQATGDDQSIGRCASTGRLQGSLCRMPHCGASSSMTRIVPKPAADSCWIKSALQNTRISSVVPGPP